MDGKDIRRADFAGANLTICLLNFAWAEFGNRKTTTESVRESEHEEWANGEMGICWWSLGACPEVGMVQSGHFDSRDKLTFTAAWTMDRRGDFPF